MDDRHPNLRPDVSQNWLEVVRQHVESLRFGTVEIIVHDSRVTQIDRTERLRFGRDGAVQTSDSLETEASPKTLWSKSTPPK